ncbi:semaphorin-4D isoform X1 [Hyla sarda]|uniref:semaphorin-4D isoform X1 n=1 Tax=Hyla sarda TaxID=327740 RepID=UPI0024C470F6|nr:semaphorin-4D isoform X1 [Hyla sarda]XP_056381415.1 semaphorin-4D isoform X1 [Hyla sarda]
MEMAVYLLSALLCYVLRAEAFAPDSRLTWQETEISLIRFQVQDIYNYSTLLLSDDKDILYIGAREVVFAVNAQNISEKKHEAYWKVTEVKNEECSRKGKSKQMECLNYIRVLQPFNESALYVCGTNAFQPVCDILELNNFKLLGKNEDGKGRCPFDPAQSYTSVMVDGDLYSGTSFTFLGSEPIIYRHSQHQSNLRTEYAVPWLNEPRFVHADVIRAPENNPEGDDDKIYFFFTEVSVEYEFFNKLLIPRIARVCKSDQGGLRTLQKKWTTFLKARMICHSPENNLIFNVVNDVFILKSPMEEPVVYGVFTSHLNNVGMSAVCSYSLSTVEDVFTKGKYMQSATVEQAHTKWVQFNGEMPKPRPGACINNEAKFMNYTSSLNLPDKTLQFVKDHPLMDETVTPIGRRPKLVHQNVTYTQIVVDQVKALDGNSYDVMFISTDKGILHKAISNDMEMRIIEEIVLFPDHQSVQTLLLSDKLSKRYIYAGSNTEVVQSPVAFCEKLTSCTECILTRDPYCAWHPVKNSCVDILKEINTDRLLIQALNGDASLCPDSADKGIRESMRYKVKAGSTVELKCSCKSKLASVFWTFNDETLKINPPKYLMHGTLMILNVTELDAGTYQCWSQEVVMDKVFSQVVMKYHLEIERTPLPLTSTTQSTTRREEPMETTSFYKTTREKTTKTSTTQAMTAFVGVTHLSNKITPTVSLMEVFSSMPDAGVGKAFYLTNPNDCSLLIILVIVFFFLFILLLTYNCYKGFLPATCLKYRDAMFHGKKKTPLNLKDCEQGVKETLVEKVCPENQCGGVQKAPHDTGYETEPDCGNGNITHKEVETTEENEKDQPFDVKCEIKYADSDGD